MEQKIRRDRSMGDNLRRLRFAGGLSQEKLCAELQRRGCDIGRSTYAKYEMGELNIRISVLVGNSESSTAAPTTSSSQAWKGTNRERPAPPANAGGVLRFPDARETRVPLFGEFIDFSLKKGGFSAKIN